MMKNNINYSTYIVIPNDSVPAAIPATIVSSERLLDTSVRRVAPLLYAATESSYSSTTRTATCSI